MFLCNRVRPFWPVALRGSFGAPRILTVAREVVSRQRQESEANPKGPAACDPDCLTKCFVHAIQKARVICGTSSSFRHATHLSGFRASLWPCSVCKWRSPDADPDELARHGTEDRSPDLLDLVSGLLVSGRDVGAAKGSGHGPALREMAVKTALVLHGVASRLSAGLAGPVRNRSLSSYTAETLASGSVPSLRIAR